MKTIADHYATFEKVVIPPGASTGQKADIKMAFYGGASVMMTLMTAISASSVSDDVGATRIERLDAELREFVRTLGSVAR